MIQASGKRTFLNAQWRKLAMVNYAVDPGLLQPYVPAGTELDFWDNTCYVSLVGFMFKDTRMLKMRIPFHINFEEINLRFYVKYKDTNGYKRGVVFIKEIVPRPALTFVANLLYNENYETMKTRHSWVTDGDALTVAYSWLKGNWNTLEVIAATTPIDIAEESEEEFITDHFWGYTKVNDYITSEYEVAHPRWQLYPVREYGIDVDFGMVYGRDFAFLAKQEPLSVYLAEGSEIIVKQGRRLKINT